MRLLIAIVVFIWAQESHGQPLKKDLIGEWKYLQKGASEPSDFILLHKSGRYIIFNDMDGSQCPALPMVEKGNWYFDPESSCLRLSDREVVQEDAGFVEWHKSYDPIIMHVDSLSEEKLYLSYKRNDKTIVEKYNKVIRKPAAKAIFTETSDSKSQLVFFQPKTLLKLTYHFPTIPTQLIITDSEGNELFRTDKVTTQEPQYHEILLADLSNVLDITSLTFEVITRGYAREFWRVEVELY
ncbi:MAG: hypothetical protein AAFQ08_02745 [Bacteroidota bacterium]